EREQVAAAASAETTLNEDMAGVESRLRELADPRARAAALRLEAEREADLLRESEGARDALDSLRKQSRALDKRLKEVERLEAAREREQQLASEVARLDEVRESLREEFRAKERLEELYAATDFIRDTLRKAGPLVTESYLYNISIDANLLFREITGEGGRALRWSKDYDILLEEGGHERSFINLSGGEQMVAALSM